MLFFAFVFLICAEKERDRDRIYEFAVSLAPKYSPAHSYVPASVPDIITRVSRQHFKFTMSTIHKILGIFPPKTCTKPL